MPQTKRRRAVPQGRIDLRDLHRITGISRSTFYRRYRPDPSFVDAWDLRDYLGKLTMDEAKVRAWVKRQLGPLAHVYRETVPSPYGAGSRDPHAPHCECQTHGPVLSAEERADG